MKKLSIITICYNEPDVEKTCESIVNQTWQDFEWIVIDGGSNKETLEVFEKYKNRIDVFISEKDNGIYNACNKGIKLANCKFIIFMNAGDTFFSNDVLLSTNPFMDKEEQVLYGAVQLVNEKKQNKKNKIECYPSSLTTEFWLTNNICTQGVFVPRNLFNKYGLFDEEFTIIADYCKWLDFYTQNIKFKQIPIIIAKYDSNGLSSIKKTKNIRDYEWNKAKTKYFKTEDIIKIEKKYQPSLSMKEKIFSIRNNIYRTHKIITILGFQFKIKRSI